MTVEEVVALLKSKGMKKEFCPYIADNGHAFLHVRKPAQIIDGRLKGCSITLCDANTWQVWTNKVIKARYYAKQFNLRTQRYTGEIDLYVPMSLADELLPRFGARIKRKTRPISTEQYNALVERLKKARNARSLLKKTHVEGGVA